MTKIFISYRRDDSAYIAGIIYEQLGQHFGADSIFFDIDSIPLGTDFRKHISDSVRKCDVLLAIVGDSWISAVDNQGSRRLNDPADFVRLEIESALMRDIPVIPVLVGKARMPLTTELPLSLQELAFRNAAEVRAGKDLQQHLARLVKGIESLSQPSQSKNKQTTYGLHKSRNDEGVATKAPRASTSLPATPSRKNGLQKTIWKRWAFSSIIFTFFLIAGLGAGPNPIFTDSFLEGLIYAVSIWLVGIFLIYKVWKRY